MTCPHCGARNTADAPWCTQCLAPLGEPPAPPTPAAPPAPAPDEPAPADAATAGGPTGPQDPDRGFRTVAEQVEWRCPACETWNPLERPTCGSCGQPLATSVVGSSRDDVAARVASARRWLWGAAAVGGLLLLAGIVLLAVFLGSGPAG